MKVNKFIKLVSFVTILAALPLHATYAGCGCSEPQSQDQRDISAADPDDSNY